MRERILSYLEKAGKPVPAARVLQDVLNIRSPNELAAGRVLKGIVGRDPRFHVSLGLWTTRAGHSPNAPTRREKTASLFLERGSQSGCARGALHLTDDDLIIEFESGEAAQRAGFAALRRVRAGLHGRLLLAWDPEEIRFLNRMLRHWRLEEWQGESLCLRKLAAHVLGRTAHGLHLWDLAAALGLPAPDRDRPTRMARFLSACAPVLLDRVPAELRTDPEAVKEWVDSAHPKVDFTRFGFGPEWLRALPEAPGVYIMRNRAQDIVYVGKSRNLRHRVRSYFTARALEDPKVARIHEQLHSIEVVTTKSEVEALLLEMRLIRDFNPQINLQAAVHEQPGTYGKERHLLLLVPEEASEHVEIYFLCDGSFVAQQPVRLGQSPTRRIQQKIRATYFAPRRRKRQQREPWEIELVFRWLAANRNRLNYIDVDEAGSFSAVIARLGHYLNDPGRLTEKVYYR